MRVVAAWVVGVLSSYGVQGGGRTCRRFRHTDSVKKKTPRPKVLVLVLRTKEKGFSGEIFVFAQGTGCIYITQHMRRTRMGKRS
ncbi:hypothetical protein C8R45DRAFT_1038414 [Mycena sanguinolenta]|nr:hypothetical protein C8R45DRAFT_1038414 [Mycena sanguinolenta]